MMMRVAIQGISGSFHEIAARNYFNSEDLQTVECISFNELFDNLAFGKADVGVMAIENTVAGSIIPNYALLKNSHLKVMGEVFLRIEQHLLALKGEKLENIKEILSHPMAIEQCHEFLNPLRRKGVKLVDSEDTALSAKRINENKLKGIGCIASDLAAELYGLDILAPNIETNKRNFTRFLVIANNDVYENHLKNKKLNKSSINFKLPNENGSLSRVLSILAYYKINLTKIQSLPVVGKEWEYMFYADLVFDDYKTYRASLDAIRPLTIDLEILGEYQKGKRPDKNGKEHKEVVTAKY